MARGGTSKRDAAARELADRAAAEVRAWQRRNEAIGGVCDFCCRPLVPGEYVTFETAGTILSDLSFIDEALGAATIPMGFDPFWAACAACEPFVSAGDVEPLVDHVIETRDRGIVGEISADIVAQVRSDLVELYRHFFALRPRKTG